MLEIQGLTYNDLPPVVPVAGTVSGNGATIGRGHDNAIILPDPMRLISRQHLKFILGPGNVYRVRNISSGNPVLVNDVELAPGMECPLQNHDKILVGGYVLQVTYTVQEPQPQPAPMLDEAGGDDFLAELLGPGVARGRAEASEAKAQAELPDPFQYGVTTSRPGDIMQTLNERGIEPNSLEGKGDDLINGEDASAMMNELLQDPLNSPSPRQSRRDNSLDPMAMFDENRGGEAFDDILQAGKGAPSNIPSGLNLTQGSELDALFQLPGNASVPPAANPAPESQTPKGAAPDIPPGGMGLVHGSELDALFGLSDTKPAASSPVAAPAVEPRNVGGHSGNIPEFDDIDSFIAGLGEESSPTPRAPVVDPLSMLLPETKPAAVPPPAPEAPARPRASSAPEASTAAKSSASPDMEELYQAFIEGLGMELAGRTALDKAFMNMLGQVVRNYTQGTVDLIAGRTVVKQAVRANVTVIAPERNNPLKFSPDGNTAVQGMFGRPLPGFMGPVEAIRNAFVDLRAHQIGVISGMQAALNNVLDRFNPAMLADKIPPRGMLENAFSVSHRARLWTEYGQYFYALREKASDHFHEFFGEAFVEAYEKAILTVQSGERTGRP